MSNPENNTPVNPTSNPEAFKHFAFIVDGEVGHISRFQIGPVFEQSIACLSSSPVIVEITGDDITRVTMHGWTHDGTNFIPPTA